MKIVAKNQNVRFDQVSAHDAFEKAVEALDEPLQEVLRAVRDLLHVPRRELGEDDEAERRRSSVTTMELVIGKPKGRAISTAWRGRPCSSASAAAGTAAPRDSSVPANNRPPARQQNTTAKSSLLATERVGWAESSGHRC